MREGAGSGTEGRGGTPLGGRLAAVFLNLSKSFSTSKRCFDSSFSLRRRAEADDMDSESSLSGLPPSVSALL